MLRLSIVKEKQLQPTRRWKKTVENKLGNVEKLDFSDKKMADMEEKITNTVTERSVGSEEFRVVWVTGKADRYVGAKGPL